MKIWIKDFLRQIILWIKMLRFKVLVRARFSQPPSLSHACRSVQIIAREKIGLPREFLALSHTYRSGSKPEFEEEEAYACSPDRQIRVHEAKFVSLGGGRYLDVGNQSHEPWPILRKPLAPKPTEMRTTLVMPWGSGGASYGDFIIKVLPKLARLLATIPESERADLGICLPYFHRHAWALDYLTLLGIGKHQILDGSTTILIPAGGELILGSGPKQGHGIAHPQDIREMIRQLAQNIPAPPLKPWRRLYISRNTGRKMANESALIGGLSQRGFEIVCLETLALHEQIRLFQEAAIIAGPHGAGHANIIWSSPGTQILEVFHPSWMHPCYAFLSEMLGIRHHCLVGYDGKSRGSWTERSRYGIFEDPEVAPGVFFQKLDSLISL